MGWVMLISISYFIISSFIILGENTLWTINFIDTLYTNIGTTPADVQGFISPVGTFLIFTLGSFLSIFDLEELGLA